MADTYHVTVSGSGSMSGESWESALPASALEKTLSERIDAGDTVLIGGPDSASAKSYGNFKLRLSKSGEEDRRIRISGVDRGHGFPAFISGNKVRSSSAILVTKGTSFVTLENLIVERREVGVVCAGENNGMVLRGISVSDVSKAGLSFVDCDDLLVERCSVAKYNRRGFHWVGACDGVVVRGSVADCPGTGGEEPPPASWKEKCSDPVGFDFHVKGSETPPNTDILMEDCVTYYNDEDGRESYEQGDGFKFEKSNVGVVLRRCIAYGNQDAAMDLKASELLLEHCFVKNSRLGYKIWFDGATVNNCIAVNNRSGQVMIPAKSGQAAFTFNFCTFHSVTEEQTGVRINHDGNTAILNDCIVSFEGKAGKFSDKTFINRRTEFLKNAGDTGNAPNYVGPLENRDWDGLGNNYNSIQYNLTKGYHASRTGRTDG
ncbi:hypothetical protein HAHE_13450 [Haloferula helveola]|uniref:Right handed beta helix domain-containing protein n=1 Tax=Haloferula helveola TaxID=490095 RepID=A0ABM7RBI7_9BACT|nr:hypothetical protein HAHE_13450 [Haloferula helveola]